MVPDIFKMHWTWGHVGIHPHSDVLPARTNCSSGNVCNTTCGSKSRRLRMKISLDSFSTLDCLFPLCEDKKRSAFSKSQCRLSRVPGTWPSQNFLDSCDWGRPCVILKRLDGMPHQLTTGHLRGLNKRRISPNRHRRLQNARA